MMAMQVLDRPHRFNAIKRRLDGVSQRVLTQTLRKLERNGMTTRTVLPGPPLGVEYGLTPLGRSMRGPFLAMFDWTIENMEEIQSRRDSFDRMKAEAG